MRRLALLLLAGLLAWPAATESAATPRVSIFYYPWYGNPAYDGGYVHWQQNGHRPPHDIASSFYPARGAYSSSDRVILGAQMAEIRAAGIDQVIASWWGRGSAEDARLPALIAAARAHSLAVAVHLEPYAGRSAPSTEADIAYLRTLGIGDFYVYRPLDLPDSDWAELSDRLTGVRLFAQTSLVGRAAAGRFDGVYTYDILVHGGASFARLCAQARRKGLLCAPSVGPGYDAARATGDTRVKPRRNGATYDSMWGAALRAGPDLVTITSYNEWHEGTQIEPAQARRGYRSYSGAYGLKGAAAERAYLERTAYWSRLSASRPG